MNKKAGDFMDAYNMIDIIIVIVVIIGAIVGFHKGFVASLFSFAGKVLAAYLSVKLIRPFIDLFQIKELFLQGLTESVNERLPLSEEVKNVTFGYNGNGLDETLADHNVILQLIGNNLETEMERMYLIAQRMEVGTLGEMLSLIVANFLLNIVSFLVLFFIILVLFSIIKSVIFKLISLSGVVSGADKFFGMILGAAVDVFILALVLGFAFDLLSMLPLNEDTFFMSLRTSISESSLQEYLYQIYRLIVSEGFRLL